MAGGFNKSGVNRDAFINAQALALKLAQDLRVDLIYGFFGQSFSKAREGRVIRRGFAQRKMQKLFKRPAVVNLVFQLRVRIDVKPLLQQHALEQQQGRICIGAFAAGADGVMIHQNGINS
jgi:hypothetical protein